MFSWATDQIDTLQSEQVGMHIQYVQFIVDIDQYVSVVHVDVIIVED